MITVERLKKLLNLAKDSDVVKVSINSDVEDVNVLDYAMSGDTFSIMIWEDTYNDRTR